MKTAVVILNWNTVAFLRRFLPGVIASLPEGAEVVVADSCSSDGSMEMMAAEFPSVRTISLDANYGFTGGYNRAISEILSWDEAPAYIVLLNSDIDTPDGWLDPLEEWMDTHPECAACGPKLHALDPDGDDWKRTERFEYAGAAGGMLTRFGYPYCRGRVLKRVEMDRGQYDQGPADVMWVTGACLMVRTSTWKQIGGLDPRFFAHMEEIDWCWRARLSGMKVTVLPQSVVYHIGGGTLNPASPFKLKLNFRNSLLMLQNNLPSEIGATRAKVRIFARMCLDRMAQAAYFLSGKREYARAVNEAYKEYNNLKKK